MRRTGKHFVKCGLQPQGLGSKKCHSQMHLHTCWVKLLQEILTDRAAHRILQKTRGHYMNFTVQWGGWKFTKVLMRQVWWQNYWKIRQMIFKKTSCVCSMIFSTLETFHHVGAKRFFRCWPRKHGLNNHLTSGPLQTSVCCVKHLLSWFWLALKHRWKHISRKNNTDSENIGGWMNTCWPQRYFWTRLGTKEFQYGLWV